MWYFIIYKVQFCAEGPLDTRSAGPFNSKREAWEYAYTWRNLLGPWEMVQTEPVEFTPDDTAEMAAYYDKLQTLKGGD